MQRRQMKWKATSCRWSVHSRSKPLNEGSDSLGVFKSGTHWATIQVFMNFAQFYGKVVGLARVELATNGLGNRCSIHLSYSPRKRLLQIHYNPATRQRLGSHWTSVTL